MQEEFDQRLLEKYVDWKSQNRDIITFQLDVSEKLEVNEMKCQNIDCNTNLSELPACDIFKHAGKQYCKGCITKLRINATTGEYAFASMFPKWNKFDVESNEWIDPNPKPKLEVPRCNECDHPLLWHIKGQCGMNECSCIIKIETPCKSCGKDHFKEYNRPSLKGYCLSCARKYMADPRGIFTRIMAKEMRKK